MLRPPSPRGPHPTALVGRRQRRRVSDPLSSCTLFAFASDILHEHSVPTYRFVSLAYIAGACSETKGNGNNKSRMSKHKRNSCAASSTMAGVAYAPRVPGPEGFRFELVQRTDASHTCL
ncbi:hypothetical protein EVAR_88614_1 [Eumeta japonica]|uniref:Uncharacterized protein n=1 Tax=Eumeta variegata TaxID=151549 RepID=A0A4C1X411_EUMVA|nr:hypothetical protein EVAR_88614_1 [Eumeta japonica]